MQILLVNLPRDARETMFPLELASAAAVLRVQGYEVKGLDLGVARGVCLPQAAASQDVLLAMPDSATWPTMRRLLAEVAPDDRRLVVVGGLHATLFPGEVIGETSVDLALRGEPEQVIGPLIRAWQQREGQSFAGAVWQQRWQQRGFASQHDYRRIEQLDELPAPDRGVFSIDDYTGMATRRARYTQIAAGRGTGRASAFSPVPRLLPGGRRVRSPQCVVDEMAALRERFGIAEFHFEDHGLLESPDYVASLCRAIRRRLPDVLWQCPGNNHPHDLTPELLGEMSASGCYRIYLSLAGVDPEAMDLLDWHWDAGRIGTLCAEARRAGVQLGGYFMLGIPRESPEQMRATVRFAVHSGLTWAQFTPFQFIPGSELFDRREELAGRIPAPRSIRHVIRGAYWKFYGSRGRWRAVLQELNHRNAVQLVRRAYDKMVRGRPF